MVRTVRAGAFATAALAFAATILWAAPVRAFDGGIVPALYFEHATAGQELSELALNGDALDGDELPATTGTEEAGHMAATAETPSPRGLVELVETYAGAESLSAEQHCLASAVYFEARGESLEGQLAVAEVVLNRAASGRYPATWCGVVVQRAQFSFVRRGTIPRADRDSEAWRRAVAISRIAEAREQRVLPQDVLWYHASYVRPSWGRRLDRNGQIGTHIFYR